MYPNEPRPHTITTKTEAMEDVAVTFVGQPSSGGATGGEYGKFSTEVVVEAVPKVQEAAKGVRTNIKEGNWFRDVSVAEAKELGELSNDALAGIYALGNAVGYQSGNYDSTDVYSELIIGESGTKDL